MQIYPPGFKPGGGEKLSMAETSLRRILQKRFDKLWKQVIDIPDLPLQGELASAGPLTMKQLEARKDGWVVAGWCRGSAGNRSIESGPGTSVPAEILSGITGEIRDGSEFPVTETAQLAKVGGEIRDGSEFPVTQPAQLAKVGGEIRSRPYFPKTGSKGRIQIERNCTGLPWSCSVIGRASAWDL